MPAQGQGGLAIKIILVDHASTPRKSSDGEHQILPNKVIIDSQSAGDQSLLLSFQLVN